MVAVTPMKASCMKNEGFEMTIIVPFSVQYSEWLS
jgi:hypothetical protein